MRRIKARNRPLASGARDMDFFPLLLLLRSPFYLFIYFLRRRIVERAAEGTVRGRPDELRPFTTRPANTVSCSRCNHEQYERTGGGKYTEITFAGQTILDDVSTACRGRVEGWWLVDSVLADAVKTPCSGPAGEGTDTWGGYRDRGTIVRVGDGGRGEKERRKRGRKKRGIRRGRKSGMREGDKKEIQKKEPE